MTTKVPALKNIPTKVDRELADTLKSMKEAQEIRLGRLGDPLDRAITLRELIDSGMAKNQSHLRRACLAANFSDQEVGRTILTMLTAALGAV